MHSSADGVSQYIAFATYTTSCPPALMNCLNYCTHLAMKLTMSLFNKKKTSSLSLVFVHKKAPATSIFMKSHPFVADTLGTSSLSLSLL
jgi:hypothetical protein